MPPQLLSKMHCPGSAEDAIYATSSLRCSSGCLLLDLENISHTARSRLGSSELCCGCGNFSDSCWRTHLVHPSTLWDGASMLSFGISWDNGPDTDLLCLLRFQ